MAEAARGLIYILCALTSIACAAMLLRGYLKTRARFLLWSSLCFVALAINNLLLVVDNVMFPNVQLMNPVVRTVTALVGLVLLLYGLIWDAE
jgi:hypothetical protein